MTRRRLMLFYDLIILISGLTSADDGPATTPQTTTGPCGLNLNGKMLTFPSWEVVSFSPSLPSTPLYATHNYVTHPYTTTNPPRTSVSPTRGVSVCLRYLSDYEPNGINLAVLTLSPSRRPLILEFKAPHHYILHIGGYSQNTWYGNDYPNLSFKPNIKFWPNVGPDIWTRLCLAVDTEKKVAQVFRGSHISIRKILPKPYVWSGEPVIDFSGFDGQVTDVQMWDYPIDHTEIYNYMTGGVCRPNLGSILTWSSISFSPIENILLDDVYKRQTKHPISGSRGKQCRPKGKKTREC